MTHLEKHSILAPVQHGFRSGHSCETQLVITMHDLMKKYDEKVQIDMLILDFSKAFDTVPHKKLLHKLENYGITGMIGNWVSSFLKNRTQQVLVDGEASDICPVKSGVPQGTVLGPLLFLLHINDLPHAVSSTTRLFADDCLLYRSIKSQSDQLELQADLRALETWAETKCYKMDISRSKTPLHTFPWWGHCLTIHALFGTHICKQRSMQSKKCNAGQPDLSATTTPEKAAWQRCWITWDGGRLQTGGQSNDLPCSSRSWARKFRLNRRTSTSNATVESAENQTPDPFSHRAPRLTFSNFPSHPARS